MAKKDEIHAEIKNTMEVFKENLIVVVVLIFTFIYFLEFLVGQQGLF